MITVDEEHIVTTVSLKSRLTKFFKFYTTLKKRKIIFKMALFTSSIQLRLQIIKNVLPGKQYRQPVFKTVVKLDISKL